MLRILLTSNIPNNPKAYFWEEFSEVEGTFPSIKTTN
jgi:hypothetical protein